MVVLPSCGGPNNPPEENPGDTIPNNPGDTIPGDTIPDEPGDEFDGLTFDVNNVLFKMVKVEGGVFTMGANMGDTALNNEFPVHQVALSDYYICSTEVTQELWTAVMGSNPSYYQGPNLPVDSVTWGDCQTFINVLNSLLASQLNGMSFRLPTEAEWEYAARGGKKSEGYLYSGGNTLSLVGWFLDNGNEQTHPVASLLPNELGIYDMSGNVWEWCSDWHSTYSSEDQINPTGPSDGTQRIRRGGSWCNDTVNCRIPRRAYAVPEYSGRHLGLRLVLSE